MCHRPPCRDLAVSRRPRAHGVHSITRRALAGKRSYAAPALGTIDLNALPDAAMTVAILAAFCQGETRIANVANLRVKETDRLRALTTELRKLGVQVTEFPDGLQINGHPETLHGAEIASYDDHRMAMCFGMAGARLPGIRIQEPGCVAKNSSRLRGGPPRCWGPRAAGVNGECHSDRFARYRQKQWQKCS